MTKEVEPSRIASHLWSVAVPNRIGPSGQPTNVYIVGRDPALVIDTGSDDGGATVLAALERLGIKRLERIILTHAHQDHAGNAPHLRAATGASVGLHRSDFGLTGRYQVDLTVDRFLSGGDQIVIDDYRFEVIETPGHAPGHISLYEPSLKALFAGDLMSGNGTIAIVPPRGSMGAYLESLRRVQQKPIDTVYPGHGPAILNGEERVAQYITHRETREEAIYEEIVAGRDTIETITDRLYQDVLPRIRPQAAGTVLAHVIHLVECGRVRVLGDEPPSLTAKFVITSEARG
ncbi:MAG TPA: MBL fold metallo-hydrolase [Nitrolancea sp.]|nr:MBL fold metallo-hydrolase [Nitrolancea sp.]